MAYGVQGDFYLHKRSDYEIFTNGCYYGNFETIKRYASIDFLTRSNSYAFEQLVGHADLESLKYIIKKFGSNLDLYLGLGWACKYGNYPNFIYLAGLKDLSQDQIDELLTKSVTGYSSVKYKQTQVFDIYLHLLKLVENPDYIKLLEANASSYFSSFDIFKDLINKCTQNQLILNPVQIFKTVCACDNVTKAEYIYLLNKDQITNFINTSQDFFIELCKNNRIMCSELVCKINKKLNYSVSVSDFVTGCGCYSELNYRIKDNLGNTLTQYICPNEEDPDDRIKEFDEDTYNT